MFIVFEDAKSAHIPALRPTHQINDKYVDVHLNNRFSSFINIDMSLVPQHEEAPIHIINGLPDECLLEIFKHLEVKDLSNAADTCVKFRAIAKDTFVNKFTKLNEPTIDQMDARTLARCLRNFGANIRSYVLSCKKMFFGSEQRYLELFCQHCAIEETAINELTINNLSTPLIKNFSEPLKLLFSNLKSLRLSECGDMTKLLRNCTELTDLWLSLVLCPGFCDLKLPKLEKLFAYLYNGILIFTNNSLGRFIRYHRTLKSLSIPLNRQMETSIIRDVALNLVHLEELTFMDEWQLSRDVAEANFMRLAELRFLKKLHLNCSGISLDRFFKALIDAETPVKDLSLECLNLNTSVQQSLSMMTEMESLTLKRLNLVDGQIMKVVQRMPHLKNLCIESEHRIITTDDIIAIVSMLHESSILSFSDMMPKLLRPSDVTAIVEAVKRRGNGIKLKIRIRGIWNNPKKHFNEQTRQWVDFDLK